MSAGVFNSAGFAKNVGRYVPGINRYMDHDGELTFVHIPMSILDANDAERVLAIARMYPQLKSDKLGADERTLTLVFEDEIAA